MAFRPVLIVIGFLTAGAIAAAQRPTPDVISAADGDLTILPVTHASVSIRYRSDVILIDPARFGPGQPPAPKPTEAIFHPKDRSPAARKVDSAVSVITPRT